MSDELVCHGPRKQDQTGLLYPQAFRAIPYVQASLPQKVHLPLLAIVGHRSETTDRARIEHRCVRGEMRHECCETVGHPRTPNQVLDRKSTRLNSSHVKISYAVFCL